MTTKINKPKNNHFLKWLSAVCGIVCRFREIFGTAALKTRERERGELFKPLLIIV